MNVVELTVTSVPETEAPSGPPVTKPAPLTVTVCAVAPCPSALGFSDVTVITRVHVKPPTRVDRSGEVGAGDGHVTGADRWPRP